MPSTWKCESKELDFCLEGVIWPLLEWLGQLGKDPPILVGGPSFRQEGCRGPDRQVVRGLVFLTYGVQAIASPDISIFHLLCMTGGEW